MAAGLIGSLSRRAVCAGGLAALAGCATARGGSGGGAKGGVERFAFAYFQNKDDGRAGMRLAISGDGRRFDPLFDGAPLIVPVVGENRLMRDPCIFDDRDGGFHMVWTTGWNGVTIGHARSPDLIHWSEQQAIPVMAAFPGTRNCWAPEAIWDEQRGCFVIFWSSTIDGAFPETANPTGKPRNHRIYCTTTTDFRSFTPTRLLYEPGFNVIDGTFLRDGNRLLWFVKDETDVPPRKYIQWCEAQTPLGPFGKLHPPITPAWSEGPTAYRSGGEIVVLFDRYRENRFGAVASRDLRHWRDISGEISVPDKASHGTVLAITAAVFDRLAAAGQAGQVAR